MLGAGTAIAGAVDAAAWVKIVFAVLVLEVTTLTLIRQFIDKPAERRTARRRVLEPLWPAPLRPEQHTPPAPETTFRP